MAKKAYKVTTLESSLVKAAILDYIERLEIEPLDEPQEEKSST